MKNKERDIGRSLLPSCARNYARAKRQRINQQNRRRVKSALSLYHQNCQLLKEQDDDATILRINQADKVLRFQQNEMVRHRRGADKIQSFLRWAKSKTLDLENNEDKYFKIKSLLGPENLITIHAMSHWEGNCPLNPLAYYQDYSKYLSNNPVLCSKSVFERAFVKCFELYHRSMNKVLKGYDPGSICKIQKSSCQKTVTNKYRVWVFSELILSDDSRGLTHFVNTKVIRTRDYYRTAFGHRLQSIDTYIKTDTKIVHNQRECPNIPIIRGSQDVSRIMKWCAKDIVDPTKRDLSSWYYPDKNNISFELYKLFCDKHILERR